MHVNASSIEGIFLCLHDKTHYIPGWNSLFDTQCIYAQAAPDQKITKEYELKLVERHKLDMEDNPCESKELGSGKMCILEAIQNEIGCRVKVLSKNMSSMSHLNQCTTGEQIGKYGATLLKITNQSQKSLYNLTGCKAPCSQNKWIPVFTGNENLRF